MPSILVSTVPHNDDDCREYVTSCSELTDDSDCVILQWYQMRALSLHHLKLKHCINEIKCLNTNKICACIRNSNSYRHTYCYC